MVLAEQVVWFV
jgi:hypothetical protein